MIEIKIGEKQPLPCPKCNEKMGYQQSDLIRTHFTSFYGADGTSKGGVYSDYQPTINEGKTAYCMNCGTKLPFKFNCK